VLQKIHSCSAARSAALFDEFFLLTRSANQSLLSAVLLNSALVDSILFGNKPVQLPGFEPWTSEPHLECWAAWSFGHRRSLQHWLIYSHEWL